MIRVSESGTIIRLGRSGRRKLLELKTYLKIAGGAFLLIFVTLLVLTVYSAWILNRAYDPKRDALVIKWFFNPIPFLKGHIEKFINDNHAAIINVLFVPPPNTESPIPTIRLDLRSNALEELNVKILDFQLGKIPQKPKVSGLYQIPGGPALPASFRLRGTMGDHHQIWKPSLGIKIKKYKTSEGFRDHVLVAPSDGIGFQNWLSNKLAENWGLLGNGEHFVRLFINNKYFGIYNRIWRFDESLLIHSNRLPGPFFRLEVQHKEISYIGNFLNWYDPQGWEVIGIEVAEGQVILNRAIETAQEILGWRKNNAITYQTTTDNLSKLNQLIDQEVFAKYLALRCHSGEIHVDGQHNNTFWLDTTSGKLVAVLQDLGGYTHESETDWKRPVLYGTGTAAFEMAWLRHPENLALYISRLDEMLNTFGSAEAMELMIRKEWQKVRPDVISDLTLSKAGSPRELIPVTSVDGRIEGLIQFIHKRTHWLQEQLSSDKIAIVGQNKEEFDLLVQGYAGVNVVGHQNELRGTLLPSVSSIVSSTTKSTDVPESFAFYHLKGRPENYTFTHRLNQRELPLSQPPKNFKLLLAIAGINPLFFPAPDTTPVVLGPGVLTLEKTREFNAGQPVTIRAGTKMLLGPEVSMIVQGPLIVEGTAENPVVIRPLNPEKPFGVVALLGKETRGSRIDYMDMEGGSVHQRYNLSFTGMFSVHDCPDVEVRNSRFGPNFIGDDDVHMARSKAGIFDTVFENALSDALDWDQVDGELTGNTFLNSGNDGIDLSMGNIRINNNYCEGSKDKCISAGEGTRVFVSHSKFYRCETGIAVKDRARAFVEDSLFDGCKIALNTYRKKWRWETGGTSIIKNVTFAGSIEADVEGDEFSRIDFAGGLSDSLKIRGKVKIGTLPVDASPEFTLSTGLKG